jgi:hypothetical protein
MVVIPIFYEKGVRGRYPPTSACGPKLVTISSNKAAVEVDHVKSLEELYLRQRVGWPGSNSTSHHTRRNRH